MLEFIKNRLKSSMQVKREMMDHIGLLQTMMSVIEVVINSLEKGGKILICGNGGSAADAQHIAAELTGKIYKDRKPLSAHALHVNGSYVTAVSNDYDFSDIYSRMTQAMGRKGDVLLAISTSGNSTNILKALETARSMEMVTIGFTGQNGGKMAPFCDYVVNVPSNDTARIQESHITLGHILCEAVENRFLI